jgi:argininosuccinate synthase
VAHGSTGAGNDQVRFDVALQMLGDDLEIVAPIRERGLTRQESTDYLTERGFTVPSDTTTYSINRGLWGTTIGGKETLTTHDPLPEEAYPDTTAPTDAPDTPQTIDIEFANGLPVAVDGVRMNGVALVETLNDIGGTHGVGRGIHVGDTILGIKGRVGFEAPAAILLITAHKELEKVVLSNAQQVHKAHLGDTYGQMMHEAQYFDPVMRDLEAFLDSSQRVVSGTVTVRLYKGTIAVQGVSSPHSMFDNDLATYGEENALWSGRDAEGFTKLAGVQARLARAAAPAAPSPAASPASASE